MPTRNELLFLMKLQSELVEPSVDSSPVLHELQKSFTIDFISGTSGANAMNPVLQ